MSSHLGGSSLRVWRVIAEQAAGLNLRAVTASLSVTDVESRDTNGIMPVVERVSRYLMTPHTEWTDAKVRLYYQSLLTQD